MKTVQNSIMQCTRLLDVGRPVAASRLLYVIICDIDGIRTGTR